MMRFERTTSTFAGWRSIQLIYTLSCLNRQCSIAWQFLHSTIHFSISLSSFSDIRPVFRSLICASFFEGSKWWNSSTAGWSAPQWAQLFPTLYSLTQSYTRCFLSASCNSLFFRFFIKYSLSLRALQTLHSDISSSRLLNFLNSVRGFSSPHFVQRFVSTDN